jgi:hypothetical protein
VTVGSTPGASPGVVPRRWLKSARQTSGRETDRFRILLRMYFSRVSNALTFPPHDCDDSKTCQLLLEGDAQRSGFEGVTREGGRLLAFRRGAFRNSTRWRLTCRRGLCRAACSKYQNWDGAFEVARVGAMRAAGAFWECP